MEVDVIVAKVLRVHFLLHFQGNCRRHAKPGIERVQALADISRSALCCRTNEIRAPIANPPISAQLEGTPTIPPSYIRFRAVVWECGEGQTDIQTDGRDHYTFRLGYASREM